jgi:uncharacterized membrane protein
MKNVFIKPEYSCTIELITDGDKKTILANTVRNLKFYCLVFSIFTFIATIPIFFTGLDKSDLKIGLFILCCLLFVLLSTTVVMFLQMRIGLKSKYKIVEKGVVTEQDNGGGDSEVTNYTYIGTQAFASLPGNINVGDKISIEHIYKNNQKKLFIRVEKI